ncbi:ABC transporter ATP-binding protein [Streptomyces sp. H62]
MAAYGLQVARGAQPVLRNVNFTLPRGCIVGLLGSSGCGKTTLLRCVVGVQEPSAGHVQVLGHAVGAWPLRTRVGHVTQAPSVYADLTVLENLRYFAAALGVRGWRREDAVVRVVKEVDLVAYADQPVSRLSGGQYSRVSLAVALLNRPDLLVMDEPTVGLDPMVRRELWLVFQRLAEEGTTLPGVPASAAAHPSHRPGRAALPARLAAPPARRDGCRPPDVMGAVPDGGAVARRVTVE